MHSNLKSNIVYDFSLTPVTILNFDFSTPIRTNNSRGTFTPPTYLTNWLHDGIAYQGRGTASPFGLSIVNAPLSTFPQFGIVHNTTGNLYQFVNVDAGTHILELYSTSRPTFPIHPLIIMLGDQVIAEAHTSSRTQWDKYTFTFDVTSAGNKKLLFQANGTSAGTTAITGITLTKREIV
jgi:hypothetical protein